MKLICPDSSCPNHHPESFAQWYGYHGTYESVGRVWQRYKCRSCGRTFSERTLSIDYWTHRDIDYDSLIRHLADGYSQRGLSRQFGVTVKVIQNRIGRLARTIIPTLSSVQDQIDLNEHLVADGRENFCVSQDFPDNIHLLVGKESQYTYGFNYALMRRKGRKTEKQKLRCELLYKEVDFTTHTITKGFKELVEQMNCVAAATENLMLFTKFFQFSEIFIGWHDDAIGLNHFYKERSYLGWMNCGIKHVPNIFKTSESTTWIFQVK